MDAHVRDVLWLNDSTYSRVTWKKQSSVPSRVTCNAEFASAVMPIPAGIASVTPTQPALATTRPRVEPTIPPTFSVTIAERAFAVCATVTPAKIPTK